MPVTLKPQRRVTGIDVGCAFVRSAVVRLSRPSKILTQRDVWVGGRRELSSGGVADLLRHRRKPVEIVPEPVTGEFLFDESPDPLDEIDLRAVRREPERDHAIAMACKPGP